MGIITSILALYGLGLGAGAAGSGIKSAIGSVPTGNDDIVPTTLRNMKSPYGSAKVKGAYRSKSNGIHTAHVILSWNKDWGWFTADTKEELEKIVAEEYEKIEQSKGG